MFVEPLTFLAKLPKVKASSLQILTFLTLHLSQDRIPQCLHGLDYDCQLLYYKCGALWQGPNTL